MAPQPRPKSADAYAPAAPRRWVPAVAAGLTLIVGLALTAAAAHLSQRQLQYTDRQIFEAAAASTQQAFTDGMTLYFLVLRSVHALLAAGRAGERVDPRRLYEALQADRHRAIRELGFVADEGGAYRVSGRSGAGEDLDLRAWPDLRSALERARETGHATLSGMSDVGTPQAPRPAIFLFKALREPATADAPGRTGWAYVELEPGVLFAELVKGAAAANVGVQVADSDAPGAPILYEASAIPESFTELTIPVAGRAWQLRLWPLAGFGESARRREPLVLLASGLIGSVLAAGLVAAVAGSRRRALRLADARTSELREQQARERRMLDNLADAIVVCDDEGRIDAANLAAQRLLGGEGGLGRSLEDALPGAGRAGTAGDRFETTARGADGEERVLEVALTRLDSGGRGMAVAVARDVTARREGERRLAAQHATTRVLSEAPTLEGAAARILEALCDGLGWDYGALWYVDAPAGVLRCVETWMRMPELAPFDAATRARTFAQGVGLPGRIWESGQPAWVEDVVEDANFPRTKAAAGVGVHGAFGFPIVGPSGILGIIEFFSRQIREPDDDLLRMAAAVGSQVGQFVERKRAEAALEESREMTRSVIDHMLEGLVVTDSQGTIESANSAAARIFGIEPKNMVGCHLGTLLGAATPDRPESFLAEIRAQGLNRVTEQEARRADGQLFPVELSLFEFATAEGRHYAAGLRDLSGRREVERLKKEFVATVSHELRTPLTSLRGSLGLLGSGVLGQLADEARDVVGIAERNTLRLITLINDILDLERLEAGRIEIRLAPVSVAALVERSCESVRAYADAQGVAIEHEGVAGTVLGDEDRLVQVLVNLLSNAVKFSPHGAVVTVSSAEGPGQVELRVSDRGRGIPADRLQDIFERFQQVEATDAREKGGTGLGLAIAKAIVELHDGEIGVASQVGRGSTFHFSVPAVTAAAARADPLLHSLDGLPAGAGPEVLLVDDDVPLLGVMARQLLGAGLAVRTATTARQAVGLAHERAPNLLVLDLGLPDGDGRDVVEALRRDATLAGTPLLAYTERDMSPGELEALRLGPTLALVKSRSSDAEFLGLVGRLLGGQGPTVERT